MWQKIKQAVSRLRVYRQVRNNTAKRWMAHGAVHTRIHFTIVIIMRKFFWLIKRKPPPSTTTTKMMTMTTRELKKIMQTKFFLLNRENAKSLENGDGKRWKEKHLKITGSFDLQRVVPSNDTTTWDWFEMTFWSEAKNNEIWYFH